MKIASKFTLGFLAASCIAVVSAEENELLKIESPADFQETASITQAKDGVVIKGKGIFLSKEELAVDPSVKYRISGEFRMKSGKPASVWLGFCPFDKKGSRIYPGYVNPVKDTQTVLAEDAKKGDKFLKVKDASKWDTKLPYGYIAFKTADGYSDLPNPTIRKTVVPNAQKNGDVWEVMLAKPMGVNYPAGTQVRQHGDNAAFIYTCPKRKITEEWAPCTGMISGISDYGIQGRMFWRGTYKVRILVLLTDADEQSETEVRNIKFTEIR